MVSLHVNFSDKEASSEAREFDPLPSGSYHTCLTDYELKECGPESKNTGKPFWALEFTVQDGPYEDRKLWTNCMLFDGALYTLAQLLKATGNEDALKSGIIPDPDGFVGKHLTVIVKKQRNKYMEEKNGDGEPVWSNEVKGIKAYDQAVAASAPSSGGNKDSLLP